MTKHVIVHFVYGGGSGATRKAEEIALGNEKNNLFKPYIIYRGKAKPSKRILDSNIEYSEILFESKKDMIKKIKYNINKYKAKIFVAHGYKDHVYGRLAAKKAEVPIIIQVEHNSQPYNPIYYFISQYLSIYTDKIVCVSNAVKNHLKKWLFNKNKMEVIYNGFYVDDYIDKTPIKDRQDGIIMVARFCSQKDHETLIKATKILKENEINCPIYLVGSGLDKHVNKSKKLAEKLDVEDRINFLGRRNDVSELLSKYKIFVLSTHYEGLSGVIMEAMAAGNVVIASDVPGVSELIKNKKTGLLVKEENPKELAVKIISALNNPDKYVNMISNAQKYAKDKLHVGRMVEEYEKLFFNELKKKNLL